MLKLCGISLKLIIVVKFLKIEKKLNFWISIFTLLMDGYKLNLVTPLERAEQLKIGSLINFN